ncbi:nucleotidyltransferase family protein [Phytohalomonas tamaricis]|uniref:nucleotidyltransferase family protein n=1 Tax=Phytohalomonas tamaricis TaxID=2081032 RepID=UPI0021D47445|nr:nucleotidyltransferase family protein [Phytohalomonas tamaricis]
MATLPQSILTDAAALEATTALMRNDPWRMACLRAVRSLELHDGWIAAGFLRNAIWDYQHGTRTPLNDIDVIYHDRNDVTQTTEQHFERQLNACISETCWEVRNQARMHVKHGHSPYRDSRDAIAHWVERPTCVGVRLDAYEQLHFIEPFGLAENWSLRVAPNDIALNEKAYRQRIADKHWASLWPRLNIIKRVVR